MDSNLNTKRCSEDVASKEKEFNENADYVTTTIGAFGNWQLMYIAIACLTRVVASWNTMAIVFLTPETNFVCKRFAENYTREVTNNTCYDDCEEYSYFSNTFEETLVSEFGLVCEQKWLISFTQTIMMFGILCGVSMFGWFSDSYGRSKGLITAGVVCAASMFATPFCPNFWSITCARFFAGIGTGGYFALSGVYISELVGSRIVGTVLSLSIVPCDGIGLPIQAGFAYLTVAWRPFMVLCSSVAVLLVSITFFLPETPRWLMAKGKTAEAADLMTRAGKFNNRDTSNIIENVTLITNQLNIKQTSTNQTYLDLFRTKKLAILTIISVSLWFITGFCYFGLLQHVSQFGSNLYIVVTVLGLVQVIASPLSVLIVKNFGRKTSSIGLYATIGALSLSLIFASKNSILAVVLGSLGVIPATVAFTVVVIIVIEIYPTSVRNMGLSVSSIGSKVAAMVAPFVVNMDAQWMASSIFALAGFSAVLICFLLPETKGRKLKDTMDECN